jgi:hypothetical protein
MRADWDVWLLRCLFLVLGLGPLYMVVALLFGDHGDYRCLNNLEDGISYVSSRRNELQWLAQDKHGISLGRALLGSFLALEALRKEPRIAENIRTVVLLAPAVADYTFEDKDVTKAVSKVGRVHIFYSNNDDVLAMAPYGILHGLGLHGPGKASSVPSNVFLHDVTQLLSGPDVHGQYLRKDGLLAISLADALQ